MADDLEQIERIYSAAWFAHHVALRADYHRIADAIVRVVAEGDPWIPLAQGAGRDVLDVGCGAAFVIERLAELGLSVGGVDGSRACLTVAPKHLHDKIAIADLRSTEPGALGSADLVICLEVAEHIDAAHADRLVRHLAVAASRVVLFSAAPPGQGGHDHINERPMAYWLERFAPYGITKNDEKTEAFRCGVENIRSMPWFCRTTVYLDATKKRIEP